MVSAIEVLLEANAECVLAGVEGAGAAEEWLAAIYQLKWKTLGALEARQAN